MQAMQAAAGNAAVAQLAAGGWRGGSAGPQMIQRVARAGAPGRTVQRVAEEGTGGHGGMEMRAEGRVIGKPTNEVERNFYGDMRAGKHPALEGVAPTSYTADQVQQMDGKAGDDSTHIYIENLTHGMAKPKLLDIKVGESTASRHELLESMSKVDAWKKKMKLKVADFVTGSASRGYRAVGGTGLKGKSRRQIGQQSGKIVDDFAEESSLSAVLVEKLEHVRAAAKSSGLAFIAASVLIAVDEEPAEGSSAASAKLNLIDFAHTFGPERLGAEQVKKYQDRFDQGMAGLIAAVKAAGAAKAPQAGQSIPT
ncbi:inositol polyphosphate kinase family protein [Streptomyces sp. CA-111067]|uniref:inositol polyphosphate kinase family protein n=1 Tax=Streptomyces sp. CA-111067 TaxID=3240046 RepID=UPI003D97264A